VTDNDKPEFLMDNADALFVVIGLMDQTVVAKLKAWFCAREQLRVRVLICVFPATSTQEEVLNELLMLQEETDHRLNINVLPMPVARQAAPITTIATSKSDGRCRIWFENATSYTSSTSIPGHFGFYIDADEIAFQRWLTRFSLLLEASVPLTAQSSRIPHLIPAQGSAEAADEWQRYVSGCKELAAGAPVSFSRASDDKLQKPAQQTEATAAVEHLCEEMGITPPDPLMALIAGIVAKGQVVTIDKSSRTPPLELPMKAEWFGIGSLRSVS
jgi:hypothetical protein